MDLGARARKERRSRRINDDGVEFRVEHLLVERRRLQRRAGSRRELRRHARARHGRRPRRCATPTPRLRLSFFSMTKAALLTLALAALFACNKKSEPEAERRPI